ncbi:hypothetical protein CsSME_00050042 [Camellia sinensis var. sinensis]
MASSAIHHLLFLSFLPFLPVFSASNITLGLSICAIGDNSSWISPSEEFAFGFRQLDNTNIFLIAIWYAKIPNKTIIWHANTTSPVQTESKVELTASGLTLNSPNGQAIWKAPLPLDTTISYATMLDTGNFVLSSSTNNFVYAWQSFSYPTDTILPTQVLSQGGMLYSRLTEANYSNGRFELHFMNGALELKAYYSNGTAFANPSESRSQLCEQSCLHDCSCMVAIFDGNITCWKKRLPLSNGRKESAIAINKTRKGALKFGSKNQVAVKRLDKLSKEGEREFKTEVSAIGKTHHTKIVQLVGYYDKRPQRLLVYELMTNESLANFLFSLPRPSWYQRTQVAQGIARGLVYLHEECDAPTIYCDIKPQNILIDEYFTTRISDFGLAKSLMFNQSWTHIGIRGTRGYVAPEWFK